MKKKKRVSNPCIITGVFVEAKADGHYADCRTCTCNGFCIRITQASNLRKKEKEKEK